MRYIFLGILSSFWLAAAVQADTPFRPAAYEIAHFDAQSTSLTGSQLAGNHFRNLGSSRSGASSVLPQVTRQNPSQIQRILQLGWNPLISGFSKFHLTTHGLSQTGYYLYRTITFPVALASSSYHHICQHISCFESTERRRVTGNTPGMNGRINNARAIAERYIANTGEAQHGKIHLAYTATNALDISLRVENLPVEGLPELQPTAQISQKPLGRTIGLQFEFRF